MRRTALTAGIALVTLVGIAEAQVSVYSVLGIGYPSRPVGASARSLGDGITAVDPGSAVNPGAIALQPRLNVIGVSETSNRSYVADGVSVDGLRDTRFPFFMLEGQLGSSPLVFGLSYSSYTDRTYNITTGDTVTIRGEDIPLEDEYKSDGGIADMRAALAWNANSQLQLGAAVHLLAGSTREEVVRVFDDPAYASVQQRGDVAYTGWGVSVGAVFTPLSRLRIGAALRRDSKLTISGALLPAFEVQLPVTLTAGFTLIPVTPLRWSVSGSWQSWSGARNDVPEGVNLSVFDTWHVGTGLQLRGASGILSTIPLRVGVRYAKLPFSPKTDQPRELSFSAGTGFLLANNRVLFEFTLERAIREGGGASERAWQLFFGLTVRP
ncbi:MAG: hypothetical protein PVH40_00980 [Gemmatimonadales bacterium]